MQTTIPSGYQGEKSVAIFINPGGNYEVLYRDSAIELKILSKQPPVIDGWHLAGIA